MDKTIEDAALKFAADFLCPYWADGRGLRDKDEERRLAELLVIFYQRGKADGRAQAERPYVRPIESTDKLTD
jgi:hypothetical protein